MDVYLAMVLRSLIIYLITEIGQKGIIYNFSLLTTYEQKWWFMYVLLCLLLCLKDSLIQLVLLILELSN